MENISTSTNASLNDVSKMRTTGVWSQKKVHTRTIHINDMVNLEKKHKTEDEQIAIRHKNDFINLAKKHERELITLVEKRQRRLYKLCLKHIIITPIDGRHIARANESIRIGKIVNYMMDKNNINGQEITKAYETKFNKQITIIEAAGTNKDHYDLLIRHTDGSFQRVEEKHSEKPINVNAVPWKDSVQVLNGVGSQFVVGEKMARKWYDEVITQVDWGKILECSEIPHIPAYDEWEKDAFRCGDPKTPFVIKIKSRCRELWGGKSSFTGVNNTPDLRSTLSNFTLTESEASTFIQQIKDKLNEVLSQKDCFLQTKGDIDTDGFEFAWRESVSSPNITSLNIRREKDIFIDLLDDENEGFTGILRWGKGCGFTNIRFDVR